MPVRFQVGRLKSGGEFGLTGPSARRNLEVMIERTATRLKRSAMVTTIIIGRGEVRPAPA